MTQRDSKPLILSVLVLSTAACGGSAGAPGDAAWPLDAKSGLRVPALPPLGPVPQPMTGPAAPAVEHLGQILFNDLRLSGNRTNACSSCHAPGTDFQAGTPTDVPSRSLPAFRPKLRRNTPPLINLAYATVFRWDGSHSTSFEDVAVLPLAEANMDIAQYPDHQDIDHLDIPASQAALYRRLVTEVPEYRERYRTAFGVDIAQLQPEALWKLTGAALAAFLRLAVSRDSLFDRWNHGESVALPDQALNGLAIFTGKGHCVECHSGAMFSDFKFHNVSVEPAEGGKDDGRFLVTGDPADRRKFLTPSLRNAIGTAPYFHNGSAGSLFEVIARKTLGAARSDPMHDPAFDVMVPLSSTEIGDLVAFLKTIQGEPVPMALLAIPAELLGSSN